MLITRAPGQSADLSRALVERGANVTSAPLIHIGPPPSERALQTAVDRADSYDWLVFTSAAGVQALASRRGQPLRLGVRIAAVGPATAAAVAERLSVIADLVPDRHGAGALGDALSRRARGGARVLIVAARDASPVLETTLRAAGLSVDKVDAYTTVEHAPSDLQARVAGCDVIALASPSAVRALARGLGGDRAGVVLRGKLVACIGPATLLEAREQGLHVEIVPERATLAALVEALCRYYTPGRS